MKMTVNNLINAWAGSCDKTVVRIFDENRIVWECTPNDLISRFKDKDVIAFNVNGYVIDIVVK